MSFSYNPVSTNTNGIVPGTNGASNQMLYAADALAPVSGNFAAFSTRNGHSVLTFDDTINESTEWETSIFSSYDSGNINVQIKWLASTATSGEVIWTGAFEKIDSFDIDNDSFGTSCDSIPVTTNLVCGKESNSTITFTNLQADLIAANDLVRFRLTRAATSGADTMVGDAQLLRVKIY